MGKRCPSSSTAFPILHQVVGDRRSASADRSAPRQGQACVAPYGHNRCRCDGHGGRRNRCGVCRWQTDADGVLGNDFDHIRCAVGQTRHGERGRSRCRMNEVCPCRTVVARILHQIVDDRRSAIAGRGDPRHGQLSVAPDDSYGCRNAGHDGQNTDCVL